MIQVRTLSNNRTLTRFSLDLFKEMGTFPTRLNHKECNWQLPSNYNVPNWEQNQQKVEARDRNEEMGVGGFDYIICVLYLVYLKPNLSLGYC